MSIHFIKEENISVWRYLLATAILTVFVSLSLIFYIDKLNRDIEFTHQELQGQDTIENLFHAALELKNIRGMRQFQFADIKSYDTAIEKTQQVFANRINKLIKQPASGSFGIRSSLENILQRSLRLKKQPANSTENANTQSLFDAYSQQIDSLYNLSLTVADQSNLILEPSLNAHYMVDISVKRLPLMIEHLGQIRGRTVSLLLNNINKQQAALDIHYHITALQTALQHLLKGQRILDLAVDNELQTHANLIKLEADFQSYIKQLQANTTKRPALQQANTLFAAGSVLVTFTNQIFNDISANLNTLLKKRLEDLYQQRRTIISGSLLTLLLIIFFIAYFYHTNRQALHATRRAKKETRDTAAQQRAILEKMIDGVITIDEKGTVHSINPAGECMFGYAADEVIGNNIKMLMPSPYHEEHDGYLENYKNTGKAHIIGTGREVEGLRKDGTIFPMDLAVSALQIDGSPMYSGIVRDITERRQMEKMKNEFISTVSHELRTPLTSIRGALGLVTAEAMGPLPDSVKEMLNIAANNTERLLLLINDILDIQKIESGMMAFRFHSLELKPFLEQAILINQSYADQYDVQFVLQPGQDNVRIYADEDRLMQVMSNLMSNAAKFSPPGDTIELNIAHHKGAIRISVSDHGPGIPDDFRDKLFDKFTQDDSSDARQKGGTGLGLSITRLIMEKHGGRIDYVSQPQVGTTFFIELPELISDLSEGSLPVDIKGQHAPCILIVEDDPDVAALLQRMLAEVGFNSDVAYTAAEARKLLRDKPDYYKAMTLDIILPDEDGIDLLTSLRQDEQTRDLPVIVVSIKADEAKRELNGGAVGILDWINKPIEQERLRHVVKHAAGPKKLPRILHVEDDQDMHLIVSTVLKNECELVWSTTLAASKTILQQEEFDLVLLDIGLPDGSGLDLFETIERRVKPPRVIIFSAQDIDPEIAQKVHTVLVKSRTTNDQLLDAITSTINLI